VSNGFGEGCEPGNQWWIDNVASRRAITRAQGRVKVDWPGGAGYASGGVVAAAVGPKL